MYYITAKHIWPWHASIIHGSTAQLFATKINPKWPPLRPDEELMFPEVHIGPRHWVVISTLKGSRGGFRVRTQYTLLTPLILDYCHADWCWLSHTDRNKRAGYCVPRLACHRRYCDWTQSVTTIGSPRSPFWRTERISRKKKPNLKQSLQQWHFWHDSSSLEAQIQSWNQQYPGSYWKNS